MNTADPASQFGGGTPGQTPGQSDGGGAGLTQDGQSFWSQNAGYLESIRRRIGGGEPQAAPQQAAPGSDPDWEDFQRWKQAKASKDPRALLDVAGLQPRDVLDSMIFGGGQQQAPAPDPIESVKSELNELRKAMQEDRQARQSVEEKIRESQAKGRFVENVRSMQDLTLVQSWGDEALDTAWNVFLQASEEASKAGQPMPSLRQAAVQVENYLRKQASRLGSVLGGGAATLELLQDGNQPPPQQGISHAPAAGTVTPPAPSPTLTNVGGNVGARPAGPVSKDELRRRALEAAKAFARQ